VIVHPWTLGRGADSAVGSSGRELQTFHGLQINLALLLASVLLAFRLWLFHFSWFLVTAPLHSLDTCQDPEREELEGVNPCNQPEDMVFRLQNHGAGSLVLPPCECNCIFSCTGTHLACAHHFRNCGGHVGTNRPYRHMSCMFAQNGLRVLCISPTATLVRRSWSSRTFGASRSPCTSCCYHLFGYKAAISF